MPIPRISAISDLAKAGCKQLAKKIETTQAHQLGTRVESVFSREVASVHQLQTPVGIQVPSPLIRTDKKIKAIDDVVNTLTDDTVLQKMMKNVIKESGVIIQTKEEAINIFKKIHSGLKIPKDKKILILDINPRKSNKYISEWYAEANNISADSIITLSPKELEKMKKAGSIDEFEVFRTLGKNLENKLNSVAEDVHIIIADDCSLSGSSMISDSACVLDEIISANLSKPVDITYTPMIIGKKAQQNFKLILGPEEISGKKIKHELAVKKGDVRNSIIKLHNAHLDDKIRLNVATADAQFARNFMEGDYFKSLDEVRQTQIIQKFTGGGAGILPDGSVSFGSFSGYHDNNVLVITPSPELSIRFLDGSQKSYSGKVPTNSAGIMELIGIKLGLCADLEGKYIKPTRYSREAKNHYYNAVFGTEFPQINIIGGNGLHYTPRYIPKNRDGISVF